MKNINKITNVVRVNDPNFNAFNNQIQKAYQSKPVAFPRQLPNMRLSWNTYASRNINFNRTSNLQFKNDSNNQIESDQIIHEQKYTAKKSGNLDQILEENRENITCNYFALIFILNKGFLNSFWYS